MCSSRSKSNIETFLFSLDSKTAHQNARQDSAIRNRSSDVLRSQFPWFASVDFLKNPDAIANCEVNIISGYLSKFRSPPKHRSSQITDINTTPDVNSSYKTLKIRAHVLRIPWYLHMVSKLLEGSSYIDKC